MARQFPVMRGIAILLVLFSHSISMSLWIIELFNYPAISGFETAVLIAFRELGLFAVPIFLFISGAFISYAVHNRPVGESYRTVKSNVLNVLYPYLIWSVIFYLINYFLLGVASTPTQYLKNLIVGYPFHFVPFLIFFYLLAPLLSILCRRNPILFLIGIFLIQLLEAVLVNPGTFGFPIQVPSWMNFLAMPVIRMEFMQWGIFFPLGMVYQQHTALFSRIFEKKTLDLVLIAAIFYILYVLRQLNILPFALAGILAPIFFMLLTPAIKRDKIPAFKWIENIGKRAYGFYLINLIVYSLILLGLNQWFPWLISQHFLLIPVLFSLTFLILWLFASFWERPPQRVLYRYLFG